MSFFVIGTESRFANECEENTLTKRKQAQLYRKMYALLQAEGIQLKQVNGTTGREIEIYNQRGELIGEVVRYAYGLIYTYWKDFSCRTSEHPEDLMISIKKDVANENKE